MSAGARHFPSLEAERVRPLEKKERKEQFEMKTTKYYYDDFTGMIRCSTPLYIKSAGTQVGLPHLTIIFLESGS